jgi:hypothetical protein
MRTAAQWKSLLDECQASDLSKTDFCKRNKISTGSLHKWQKYFDKLSVDTGAEFIDITEPLCQEKPTPSLNTHSHHWQVELELGSGMVLRIHAH